MTHSIHDFINRLRSIEEAEAPAQAATNIDAYKPQDGIPEIKANGLAKAKEQALKQLGPGKKFRFCQIYSTKKASSNPVRTQPAAQDQWSYLGGNNVIKPSAVREALESLRRAARLDELKIGDIDPRNGKKIISAAVDGQGNVVRSGTGEIWNVQYGEPDSAPVAATPAAEPAVATPVNSNSATGTALDPLPAEPARSEPMDGAPARSEPMDGAPQKCTIEDQARIKYMSNFNQAFAAAVKAGCETFAWCGIYTTGKVNTQPSDIPAATGNTSTYAQGINMAVNRARLKGVIAKDGPYTEQDVKKVLAGLANGTIGYQLDPKSHSPEQIATFSRMLRNQMLKGDKRAGSNYDPNIPRNYK
jgi:hypothetical protein